MTNAERAKKILSSTKDADALNDLLNKGNFLKADSKIEKIATNTDYAEAILASRIKHKIPYGNMPFGSLSFTQQRNVVIMLIEAVEATIIKLSLSNNNNKE